MSGMVERHCRSCQGCQAVTPLSSDPPVKTTTMPTKPWRDLAVDLMGPLPTGESLLVTVDYYSRWVEVDVIKSTTSRVIIDRLEKHFTRHGIPQTLRTDNGANLVSEEMAEFLKEMGVKHKKTIPLWPRANGEVERQNRSLLKAMRAAQAEGKLWQRELQKFLIAYRSTPHTTTGVSPAWLLYGREIRTKLPGFEEDQEEGTGSSTDQEARDVDAEHKQKSSDMANKRTVESDVKEGDEVLLQMKKQDKLSPLYDPNPYVVTYRNGDLLIIEREGATLRRNVGHVKRFITASPVSPQVTITREVTQEPLWNTGAATKGIAEPPTVTVEEPTTTAEVSGETEPTELRRSTRDRTQPRWLQDFVTD